MCSNGEDDDLDALIDYPNDPGCDAPADESEEDPPFRPNAPMAQIMISMVKLTIR